MPTFDSTRSGSAWRGGGAGVPVLTILVILGVPERALAQDCGAWSRPVLCEAALVATDADGDSDRLDVRSRYRIAPRGRIDLELDGRDQRGRRFPEDRVVLSYDDAGCGGLLDIEDRGRRGLRITAQSTADRCRLAVWVPGNLNFEWEIEFEVDPAARTSYSRGDSEHLVDALYSAILDRDPDAPESTECRRRSAAGEPREPHQRHGQEPGVRRESNRRAAWRPARPSTFYVGIFDRPADTGGVREYLDLVRSGRYTDALLRMIRSPEFERRLSG